MLLTPPLDAASLRTFSSRLLFTPALHARASQVGVFWNGLHDARVAIGAGLLKGEL